MREPAAEQADLVAHVLPALPRDRSLAVALLEPPPRGLERERLRVALGERVFETRKGRRVGAQELFDLLLHRVVGPVHGRGRSIIGSGSGGRYGPGGPSSLQTRPMWKTPLVRVRAAVAAL